MVRAQVSRIRLDEAAARAEQLAEKAQPLLDEMAGLREPDLANRDRLALLGKILQANGGVDRRFADLRTVTEAAEEQRRLRDEAVQALNELYELMGDPKRSVHEWIGCTQEELLSAVEAALAT